MINNDILRRLSKIFNFDNAKLQTIFSSNHCELSNAQIECLFKEKDEADYQELSDEQFASFLNGLIDEKRGSQDGKVRQAELALSNNMIFNKIKIALALKADEVIEIIEMAGITLGKYELSAFFRNVNHKHYKDCSDEVLSAFLSGLKLRVQG